jgi:hypothetical protein
MFCSLNLRVVELWSLPELDLVKLVFSFLLFCFWFYCCWCKQNDSQALACGNGGCFLFCCFVFGFIVVGANRRILRLWPVGMADVGGYLVELCFIVKSISFG